MHPATQQSRNPVARVQNSRIQLAGWSAIKANSLLSAEKIWQ